MSTKTRVRWVIARDLMLFHLKLAVDGLKDVFLAPIYLLAACLDLAFPGQSPGRRFYIVMGIGERFDRWISLFSAASKASALEDGLFGASRAGAPSFLGKLEEAVIGYEEPVIEQ